MDAIIEGFMRRFRHDHDLDGLSIDQLFETFAAYCIIRKFHANDFEPNLFRMGGSYDLGIDAAAILVNGTLYNIPDDLRAAVTNLGQVDADFILVQAKTGRTFLTATFTTLASNLTHVFTETPLTLRCSGQVKRLRACIDTVYKDSDKLFNGLPRLHVFYVAAGNPNLQALEPQRLHAVRTLQRTGWFGTVTMQPIGVVELRDLYRRAHDANRATFNMTESFSLPKMPGVERAYMGIVSAHEFVRRVLANESGRIRRTLFYDNVRDFQRLDNPINADIQESLQDPDRSRRFAIMNNGITIVTRGLTIKGHEFQLRDFQIVNGCQTCHVLFYERSRLTEDTQVPVRIIETQDSATISDVVVATNRQTMVQPDDFEARSGFHKQLEDFFAAQLPPRQLYYERRSGQYGITGKVPDEVVPMSGLPGLGIQRTRIIQPNQLARAFASVFLGEAWRASAVGGIHDRAVFKVTSDPLPYYTSAAVLYRLEYLIRNRKIPEPFAPAKYHLMAAAKCRLVGDSPVPGTAQRRREVCNTVLDCMWDSDAAEALLNALTQVLVDARNAERPEGDGELDGVLLRSKSFADRVRSLATTGN
jgi:AIPR protein